MTITIEKDIYVRDKYRVRRQAFKAGQVVDLNEYNAVLSTNAVVNPKDLPKQPVVAKRSIETKMLPLTAANAEPEVVVNSEEEAPKVLAEPKSEVIAKESAPKKETVKKTETKKKTDN